MRAYGSVFIALAVFVAAGCSSEGSGQRSAGPDTTAPTVQSTSPDREARGRALTEIIRATFSEVLDASTVTPDTFRVQGNAVSISGTVACSGMTASFTPDAPLDTLTTYTVTITTGVRDPAGNALKQDYTWAFSTKVPPWTGNEVTQTYYGKSRANRTRRTPGYGGPSPLQGPLWDRFAGRRRGIPNPGAGQGGERISAIPASSTL